MTSNYLRELSPGKGVRRFGSVSSRLIAYDFLSWELHFKSLPVFKSKREAELFSNGTDFAPNHNASSSSSEGRSSRTIPEGVLWFAVAKWSVVLLLYSCMKASLLPIRDCSKIVGSSSLWWSISKLCNLNFFSWQSKRCSSSVDQLNAWSACACATRAASRSFAIFSCCCSIFLPKFSLVSSKSVRG